MRLLQERLNRGGLSVQDYILLMGRRRFAKLGPKPVNWEELRKKQKKEEALRHVTRVSHAGRTQRRIEEERALLLKKKGTVAPKSKTLGNSLSPVNGGTFGNFPQAK